MKLSNLRFVKIGGGIILGGVAGLGFSFLSGWLGSSCTIMCNPYIAGSMGMLVGALFVIGD